VNYALRPVQGAIDGIASGVAGVFGSVGEIERLHADNTALRQENERLTAENLRAEEIERQNDLLTGLLQLQNSFEYKTVAAEVISRESSEFRRVVTISKGSDDGIAAGDVVIAEGGALAGRVVELGPNFAKVVLITDQSSTVIGQLQSSLATGEVVGTLEETLQMKNVDSTEGIELGEEVTTAGIEPRISFRTRSFELIRGLIGHRQGYSIHNAVPRTTIGSDGSRIAVVPITERLPPTHVTALRLKRHELRPAVQTFADYAREAFAVGGQFAPGSIAPVGIDAA